MINIAKKALEEADKPQQKQILCHHPAEISKALCVLSFIQ